MRAYPRLSTALAVLFVLCCTAAAQAPQSPETSSLPVGSATVTQVKGEIVLHGPQGETLSAQPGLVLAAESIIETEKGNILLELQDGSQVLVKPHSRVVLKSPDQGKGYYLELLIGRVVNKIQKRLGNTPSFRMGTPTAVITVRGTRFEVEVTKKLRTYVEVYEGNVEVQSLMEQARSVMLRPGYFTNVDHGREPTQPQESRDYGQPNGSDSGHGGQGDHQGDHQGGDRQGGDHQGGSGSDGQQGGHQGRGDSSGGHEGPGN
jgi:hypothetical protein